LECLHFQHQRILGLDGATIPRDLENPSTNGTSQQQMAHHNNKWHITTTNGTSQQQMAHHNNKWHITTTNGTSQQHKMPESS